MKINDRLPMAADPASLIPGGCRVSNNTTPQLMEWARRLLSYEVISGKFAGARSPAVFRVCKKLGGPLGRAMGVVGFRSLLSRALALADAEVPGLRGLRVKADGSLDGADELKLKLYPQTVNDAEVILVSQVFGLLVTFIGPALTFQLLLDIWPQMSGGQSRRRQFADVWNSRHKRFGAGNLDENIRAHALDGRGVDIISPLPADRAGLTTSLCERNASSHK